MTKRSKTSNSIISNGIRHEIIEKTIDIIAQNGSWNISVADIAKGCNLTSASLYNHFSSKNEIFKEALMLMEEKFDSIVNLPIPDKIPEEMKIRMISFYIFDFVGKNQWAVDFVDPFSEYESTHRLLTRIENIFIRTKLSKDELNYRIYRFMAGIHFKIKYRFMRGETLKENDIDDLSRFMAYPETAK